MKIYRLTVIETQPDRTYVGAEEAITEKEMWKPIGEHLADMSIACNAKIEKEKDKVRRVHETILNDRKQFNLPT